MEEVINFDLNNIKEEQVNTIVKCLLETIKENFQYYQDKEFLTSLIINFENIQKKEE